MSIRKMIDSRIAENAEVNGTNDIDDINGVMIKSDGKRMDATLPQSNDSNPLKTNTAGNRMEQYSVFFVLEAPNIFGTHLLVFFFLFVCRIICPFVFLSLFIYLSIYHQH